jgi:hypothetical protein
MSHEVAVLQLSVKKYAPDHIICNRALLISINNDRTAVARAAQRDVL